MPLSIFLFCFSNIEPLLKRGSNLSHAEMRDAAEKYESEMIERPELGVLASR